jgi:hypothetical protein
MSATVEITEDGEKYTATDTETGISGEGSSKAQALLTLAVALGDEDEDVPVDTETALRAMSAQTQERFEEQGVTEDDVEDAIAWARSE